MIGETKFEQMETLAGFITFGSPISLFALAFEPSISFEFPPEGPARIFERKGEVVELLVLGRCSRMAIKRRFRRKLQSHCYKRQKNPCWMDPALP